MSNIQFSHELEAEVCAEDGEGRVRGYSLSALHARLARYDASRLSSLHQPDQTSGHGLTAASGPSSDGANG